jgi:MYXO-CTERM domain-containing protein
MLRNRGLRWALGLVFIISCGTSCDSAGCDILAPMPDGNEVPMNQTIEGGMQLRITPTGFEKISAIIPGILENMGDFTVIEENSSEFGDCNIACVIFTSCPGGCNVDMTIPPGGAVVTSNSSMLLVDITLDVMFVLDARVEVEILGLNIGDVTCGLQVDTLDEPLHMTVGIEPYIRDVDGELRLRLVEVSDVSLAGISFGIAGCGPVGDFFDTFFDNLNSIFDWLDVILGNVITEFIVNNFVLPLMQDFIDDLLPDPLGLEGQFDIGSLLAGFSPGTEGILELRLTPGGYVNLQGNGMSLGVITGVNSDSDPTTRSATMDPQTLVRDHSEPHRKMPPMPTPDFSGTLSQAPVPRQTAFKIDPSSEMGGFNDGQYLRYKDPNGPLFDQTADLAIGTGETFLNLVGFHLLNSGALCLEIGTQEVDMLTVGLFSIMVNSLGELVDPLVGDAPMRLVIRPQTPLRFDVLNNMDENNPQPLLKMFLEDFQIDMYAFSEERYVLAFTMAMDMELGLNLMTEVDPNDGVLYLVPLLEDVDAANLIVRIHNSELIADSPEELETLFPSVLSMLMPMITGMLPEIAMPELMGISMEYLEFRANDAQDMMLILASLAVPSPVPPAPLPVLPVQTDARLEEVTVPTPDQWRASQLDPTIADDQKDVPTVRIAVTPLRARPDEVQWQYRLNGTIWRGFRSGPELVIRDKALTFQGWHQIEVRGMIKGRPTSLERQPQRFDVLIDSMPPLQRATVAAGEVLFNGFDLVTARNDLRYSYEFEPGRFAEWSDRGSLPLERAQRLAQAHGGVLRVRVMDESGNVSESEIGSDVLGAVPVNAKMAAGCGCTTSGGSTPFAVFLLGLLALVFVRRRRSVQPSPAKGALSAKAAFTVLGAIALVGMLAMAGCAKKAGAADADAAVPSCTDDDECAALQCEDGQIPLCVDGTCQCMNDLLMGKIGQYSSLAVSYSDIMVSAYNARYGDLMFGRIAKNDIGSNPVITGWEFVDGVPWDQEPDIPTSDIRNGIRTKGTNVGRFTSIGTNSEGHPVIAYYDVTHGALKLARFDGTNWTIMVVDDGGDSESADGGDAGRYTAISMRTADRAPGISYMVQNLPSSDASATVSQVRYAQAITGDPSFGSDWNIYIVDEVEVPLPAEDAPLADWPTGIGVTTSVSRTSDDRPVVVYYDSVNGNLKGAEFDTASGGFADPVILDGDDGLGGDTGDVGLYSSVRVHGDDTVWHVSYMDKALKQLRYLRTGADPVIEVVDDGLRQETNAITGLPMPVSHFVGFDSKVTVVGNDPDATLNEVHVVYQDSTTHEILWAERDPAATSNPWGVVSFIGGEKALWNSSLQQFEDTNGDPWEGSFGFYLGMADDMTTAYLSCFAINEWAESDLLGNAPLNYWVQIFAVNLSEG